MRLITARVNQDEPVLMGAMVIGLHALNERHQSDGDCQTDSDGVAKDGDHWWPDGVHR